MYETSSTTTVEGPTGSTSQLVKRKVKKSQDFVPLKIALNQSWKGEKSRKLKRLRLSPGFFATLGERKHEIVKASFRLNRLIAFPPYFSLSFL